MENTSFPPVLAKDAQASFEIEANGFTVKLIFPEREQGGNILDNVNEILTASYCISM